MNNVRLTDRTMRVFALCKPGECYMILYDAAHKSDALRTLGRWASDPGLSLTWYDAAKASQTIRSTR